MEFYQILSEQRRSGHQKIWPQRKPGFHGARYQGRSGPLKRFLSERRMKKNDFGMAILLKTIDQRLNKWASMSGSVNPSPPPRFTILWSLSPKLVIKRQMERDGCGGGYRRHLGWIEEMSARGTTLPVVRRFFCLFIPRLANAKMLLSRMRYVLKWSFMVKFIHFAWDCELTPILFYKNTFYKNIQAEIPEKIRTLIRTCQPQFWAENYSFCIWIEICHSQYKILLHSFWLYFIL